MKCDNCCQTKTPQWRKGKNDKKILCNACGVYYNRNKINKPTQFNKTTQYKYEEKNIEYYANILLSFT